MTPLKRNRSDPPSNIHLLSDIIFCEYLVRAEARRESWMDCICWLEHNWILQVNSNLKQYCTRHNECESKPLCSQNERSSTFSHCHTLNVHSFSSNNSHFILILNVDLLYPSVENKKSMKNQL